MLLIWLITSSKKHKVVSVSNRATPTYTLPPYQRPVGGSSKNTVMWPAGGTMVRCVASSQDLDVSDKG